MTKLLFFIFIPFITLSSLAQVESTPPQPNSTNATIPKSPSESADVPTITLPVSKNTPSPVQKADLPSTPESVNPSAEKNNDFKRDPFRLPEYLIRKIMAVAAPIVDPDRIDDTVEPIVRWPIVNYTLIGIIWDVKSPKALVADLQRKVHLIRLNDKIGNQGGYVTSIREGSIVVLIGKIPEVLKLKK